MSLEDIRTDITTAVSAAVVLFTTYPLIVEYDNREIVDFQTQTNPFLVVKIKVLDAEQADLSDHPTHRIYGQIHIAAAVPKGSGSALANKLLDHFYPKLQRKKLGNTVQARIAVPAEAVEHNGWCYYSVLIPFWSDQTT